MATEYTITYTYTGQANTKIERSVAFSRFTASGDTDRSIGQITSITYEHYHTSTNSMTWNLRGRLVFADGSAIDSENVGNHISGNVVKYVNTFSTLPSAEQFATLSYVQTLDSNGSTGDSGYYATLYWRANSTYPMKVIVTFIEEPPVVYAPAIESFSLQRCNESAMPDDEGIYIATSLKLAIGDAAGLDGAQMRIYYAANAYPIVGESQYVDLSGRISELLSGVETNTGILTGAWNAGNTWYFAAVFTAGEETAIATGFIPRGSTSFHISDEPGGGAAVGGFSSGTTASPKFESHVPAHFYDGIDGVTNYINNEVMTGGKWIDGKPIYRRVVSFTLTAASEATAIAEISEIDTLVHLGGSAKRTGYNYRFIVAIPHNASTTSYNHAWIQYNNLYIASTHAITGYVIVEYTKNA